MTSKFDMSIFLSRNPMVLVVGKREVTTVIINNIIQFIQHE